MFKKLSRAGLAALVCGLVFGAFISVAAVDVSFAQATAPAAEAPAATAPPACDAKTLKDCAPNSGDTAWMLTSVALVLMMTIPGLGLFYGGMVRKKNVADTVMTSFAITCLITVLWAIVNYSTAFTEGTPFIGGLSRAFLQGIVSDPGQSFVWSGGQEIGVPWPTNSSEGCVAFVLKASRLTL